MSVLQDKKVIATRRSDLVVDSDA
ncbi:uncharacterized protein G2W53_000542 [Senna tora]|uniref:Uncharacterized protein n=1 Tax=Senna tora TaxID=362788 RepID=A0A834XG33_9FABA|nr:uncharacterized protein G2W53_000542 [Senna tora]